MSSTRTIDPQTGLRIRPPARVSLADQHGWGARVNPAVPANPIAAGSPAANAVGNAISAALTGLLKPAIATYLGAGEVLIGVILVVVGLLLATGRMRPPLR